MSNLSAPHFHNEEAAYAYVEARVWPNGATCPKCGERDRVSKMGGKSTRIGVYKCYACRKPFTVKVGTVFESSHVPLNVWLQAIYLMVGSKKGISSNQLHRTLGVTLKTAWFMSHRIREAMRSGDLGSFGSDGGMVEADETFIGHDKTKKPPRSKGIRGAGHKHAVLALVDRSTGRSRTLVVENLKAETIGQFVRENVAKEATLMTDEFRSYSAVGKEMAGHRVVKHKMGEYVNRKDRTIHTNTIEGYFSIFKRGMRGIYQHCGKRHLHRYLAEFDFRYSNRKALGVEDRERADVALLGIVGKRLTYQTIGA
jgi:transposase-like protein